MLWAQRYQKATNRTLRSASEYARLFVMKIHRIIILIIIIIIIISFMQVIYTYIPETNYVPR